MATYRSKGDETVLLDETPDVRESDEAAGVWTGPPPGTELGQLLPAARRECFAAEERFLGREERVLELAKQRGGSATDDEA